MFRGLSIALTATVPAGSHPAFAVPAFRNRIGRSPALRLRDGGRKRGRNAASDLEAFTEHETLFGRPRRSDRSSGRALRRSAPQLRLPAPAAVAMAVTPPAAAVVMAPVAMMVTVPVPAIMHGLDRSVLLHHIAHARHGRGGHRAGRSSHGIGKGACRGDSECENKLSHCLLSLGFPRQCRCY
jgi:hypothetical protein